MKILQLIHSFNIGGSELLALKLSRAFKEQGTDSFICAIGQNGAVAQLATQYGIPTLYLDKPCGVRLEVMVRLVWLAKTEQCDVVLAHHFRQLLHVLPGALFLKKKVFHVEHDFHFYENNTSILRKLDIIMPFIQKIICVSDAIRDEFIRRLPHRTDKFISIPNGIDTQLFRCDNQARELKRIELGIRPDTIVLGTCARLEPIKDLPLLLNGFAQLLSHTQRDNNVVLVIVGEGSQKEALLLCAKKLGIHNHCYFVGGVTDVHAWLNLFDIYALTSQNEGLPLSIMEAMATELPVVAVNVGSVNSIINQNNGVLLSSRSEVELGEQLMKLTRDEERRRLLGKVGRSIIKHNFSFEKMVNSYKQQLVGE
jgi:glycosyltransferase involved in cell wall biosynthesis